ncbi:GNAT family N-acetyltransferase [Halorussus salilacus]|uniref:GNAT family N-acetyltransferase n=1 Tax=Halorussus salilacus TaxID=2953750 RepID=UPI00209DE43C|nr:GNAT family N-acetyltransferase [Halorussus salilacus]USZ68140.1 GNAT family N-acetyltransferase [Halorussus salilacus]
MTTVEAGTLEDVDAVADRWVSLAEGQRAFGSHLLAEDNRERVRDALARRAVAGELLVARADEEVVGFVSFGVESGRYEQDTTRGVVQNIYVAPECRREGVGSELLAAAEESLVESGVETLTLEVMADNDAAREFYRCRGYRPHRIEMEKRPESDTLTKE